jgi:hypothetical protein
MLERIYDLAETIATDVTKSSPDWAALADAAEELARLTRQAEKGD